MTNNGGVYTIVTHVGTPGQPLNLVADTGSYNLLIASTLCTQPECATHNRYDPTQSTTFVKSGVVTVTGYGQGKVASLEATETVGVGQMSATDPSPAYAQDGVPTLIMEQEALKDWERSSYDGIMGLGKRNTTDTNQTSLLSEFGVEEFTVCLGGPSVGYDSAMQSERASGSDLAPEPLGGGIGGRLTFSAEMPELEGQFQPLDVIGENAWGLELDGWSINGAEVADAACNADAGARCAALVDTGTTLFTVPQASFDAVMNAIEAGCLETDCLNTLQNQETCTGAAFEALPPLTLHMGGAALDLAPSVYMAELEVEIPAFSSLGPFIIGNNNNYAAGVRCVPLFSAFPANSADGLGSSRVKWTKNGTAVEGAMVILGQPFFRAYATKFDRPTYGIAVAPIPIGSEMCNTCTDEAYDGDAAATAAASARRAAAERERYDASSASGRHSSSSSSDAGSEVLATPVRPAKHGKGMLAAAAVLQPEPVAPARRTVARLALSDVRVPWYALPPSMRTVRGNLTAAVKTMNMAAMQEWVLEL